MKRIDKLFVDNQFDPLDSHSLDDLLDIPLQKELPKEKRESLKACIMNFGICTHNLLYIIFR